MEIRNTNDTQNLELPLQLHISFKKVFDLFVKYGSEELKDHPFHESSKVMIREIEKYPALIDGFSDFSLLNEHEEIISLLLDALFPEILTNNEIKAATIPFSFTSFKFTERFKSVLANAGEDYNLQVRNLEDNLMYIHACTLILAAVYNRPVDLKRPFFFDIPDQNLGVTKHYRVAFNGDFMEIVPTKNAPKITDEDIKLLLDNFGNLDIWREKFPPNSYIFKGFGIMNLFDVTSDETLTAIRTNLLEKDDGKIIDKLRGNLSEFYAIKDLKVGFSVFDVSNMEIEPPRVKKSESIIIEEGTILTCNDFFCDKIVSSLFNENEDVVISDIETYGFYSTENKFYQRLKKINVGSIILIPIKTSNNKDLILLEIASPRAYELNSVNKQKLKDIIPVFEAAAERNSEEFMNVLEATIQEHYTSIHPSVKWRFYQAAENYQNAIYAKKEDAKIEQIVFEDVYPLYGQIDIKGSSIARNTAIKEDLITQLSLAIKVLNEACKTESLPIYEELIFRVNQYLTDVETGLKAGDEVGILDFLKKDIYPVFNHIKEVSDELEELVNDYTACLDENLHVVYNKRKSYEESVTKINDKLARFLDNKQEEAQAMFPHYFERYKTDGVEYNMYIGQSLTKEKKYDNLYLYNLRLWQLQTMCEMENLAHQTRKSLSHDLEVASLILVHSNSLAIKFRMEEKQFDVDGAYNIRYEIIKKRIDKSHIKNTNERLTIPGKISIVYSQDKDALEYLKYIKYLQSKNLLGSVEMLELEDLQGVSGLKAIRVEVIYSSDFSEEQTITLDELLHELN
ncbi:hypothetical protein SAMN04489761_4508 [Tenacibaculum sp. MAR_2009_124]|uniref:GAF domain-containing protein n=1 Tax=Tenacibaculum sp. MAR_2009_124 TaxID=1250059 RepID=UPI000894ADB7|nr:GAF domain-containing protein [Tenacibaculum sp. MAR_2009_124]SED17292.1 hypothetical protein SAMN04489761_4508 [Tenacibaculum sp. MAR_2009_124]